MALAHLLNNGMKREDGQWRIDYAHVALAEGQRLNGFPVKVNRHGSALTLSWEEGLPEGTRRTRLAFHNATRQKTLCLEIAAPKKGKAVSVLLPKWAQSGALHMWWRPVVTGKAKWQSAYLLIPEAVIVVVGCVLAWNAHVVSTRDIPLSSRATLGAREAELRVIET